MPLDGETGLLRIFIGESDQHYGRPLAEMGVERAKKAGLAGATGFRGSMGFGANSRIHKISGRSGAQGMESPVNAGKPADDPCTVLAAGSRAPPFPAGLFCVWGKPFAAPPLGFRGKALPKIRPKKSRERRAGRKMLDSAAQAARKEELLRPNPYLGYGHERLADHLMEREAYALAEQQYRRMIWLNPFEPRFQEKLERCLKLQRSLANLKRPAP